MARLHDDLNATMVAFRDSGMRRMQFSLAVLGDKPAVAALVQTIAVAARLPLPLVTDAAAVTVAGFFAMACMAVELLGALVMMIGSTPGPKRDQVSAAVGLLLKTQWLQAAARSTAQAVAALSPGSAATATAAAAAAPRPGPGPRQGRGPAPAAAPHMLTREAASQMLRVSMMLFNGMGAYVSLQDGSLVPAFAKALGESRFLEHAARLLLVLAPRPGPGAPEPSEDLRHRQSRAYVFLCTSLCSALTSSPPASPLPALFAARPTRHTMLALGISALDAADGLGTCGLLQGMLTCVPVGTADGTERIVDVYVMPVLVMVAARDQADAQPVLSRGGAAAVLLRVGRLALASLRVWDQGGGGGSGAGGGGGSGGRSAGGDGVQLMSDGSYVVDLGEDEVGLSSMAPPGSEGASTSRGGPAATSSGGSAGGGSGGRRATGSGSSGSGSGSGGGGGSRAIGGGGGGVGRPVSGAVFRYLLERQNAADVVGSALEALRALLQQQGPRPAASTAPSSASAAVACSLAAAGSSARTGAGAPATGSAAARAGQPTRGRWRRLTAVWRLAVGGSRLAVPHLPVSGREPIVEAWLDMLKAGAMPRDPEAPLVPQLPLPAPPPGLAAALAAGALPGLEHALRRVSSYADADADDDEDDDSSGPKPYMHLLIVMERRLPPLSEWLPPLIMYGEPRQAVPFIATAAKLLRRSTIDSLLQKDDDDDPSWGHANASFAAATLSSGLRLLAAASSCPSAAEGPADYVDAGGDAASGVGRLCTVQTLTAAFTAVRLLPMLSRLVRAAAAKALRSLAPSGGVSGAGGTGSGGTGGARVDPWTTTLPRIAFDLALCSWLEILGVVCGLAGAASVAPAPGPQAAAGTDSAAPAAATTADAAASASAAASMAPASVAAAAAASATAAFSASGEEWRAFLLEEVKVVPLLGALLCLLELRGRKPLEGTLPSSCFALDDLSCAVCAVAAAFPAEVAQAAHEAQAGGANGRPPAAAFPWRPEALRLLAWHLGEHEADEPFAITRLAQVLEDAGDFDWSTVCRMDWVNEFNCYGAAIKLLAVRPSEARALLPPCANPNCFNIAGGSEAELQLQRCGKCKSVSYCCRECQMAHWRAGHKDACGAVKIVE
ncbi:hypothetical protein HYH03_007166 [Edaphochlamys debaryana]|uniref:phytol kinase n=1 Tax=Edaphochlamys debaryana TaxID=47281 RepID=A0A836BZG4_9CHLO|nr:hypothetical protein HYH03_007166 [Edaphochlamys debaryana]|eukprot:KAG2494650.1 hypothetical protein HYH03_007166 [Edaphochlamys debaryana]